MSDRQPPEPRRVSFSIYPPALTDIRFFVDEDLIGVGRALMASRTDVAVATLRPLDTLVPTMDEEWIPVVADHGWVAITNDKHIRTREREATAARNHGLRCVHLKPPGKDANRWAFVRLLVAHWKAVESLTNETGPAWLALTQQRARDLDYQPGQPPRLPSLPEP